MSLQLYLAFVVACIALALVPGPVVTLVIANGLRHGTRAALTNIRARATLRRAEHVCRAYGARLMTHKLGFVRACLALF